MNKPLAMKYTDTTAEIIKKLKISYYIDGHITQPRLLYKKSNNNYIYRINFIKKDIITESKLVSVTIKGNTINVRDINL